MKITTSFMAAITAACLATGAFAGEAKVKIQDAYARSTNPQVAAAFLGVMNHADADDRLIGVSSDAAKRVQLHTHREKDGVMSMIHAEEGFAVPAGEVTKLARGGDHVMLMGLTEPLKQGDVITVTLTFEKAGDVTLEIPIDNDRKPESHAHSGHGDHADKADDHSDHDDHADKADDHSGHGDHSDHDS